MYYTELGYDSYDEYLAGEEWHQIRSFFYSLKTPYRCKLCHKRDDLLVHKRSYFHLTPEAFKQLKPSFIKKILVYFCHRCNHLVHFQKGKKVPLDYLYLWEREKQLYFRLDMVIRRLGRDIWGVLAWIVYSFNITSKPRRKPL